MSSTNTGVPAFPLVYDDPKTNTRNVYPGLTLRDYFAAAAMNGICNSRSHVDLKGHATASARVAYELADAMLKAREQ